MKTFSEYKDNVIHALELTNVATLISPTEIIKWERIALEKCGLESNKCMNLITHYGADLRKLAEQVLEGAITESEALAAIQKFAKKSELSNDLLNAKEWPKLCQAKLIQPGVVNYDDIKLGNLYVDKDALDKIVPTFVLKPIVRKEDHKSGMTPEDWERVAVGICTRVWWNPDDGWFWCEFAVWDDKANAEAKSGFVSCSYEPSETGSSGEHNNVPYEVRVFNGVGKHIAIVPNPRYDEARIILVNSKGGRAMFNLFRKKGKDGKVSSAVSDFDTLFIPSMNKRITIKDLMNAADIMDKEVKEEVSEDAILTRGGKEYRIGDLVNAAKSAGKLKNDDGEDKGVDDKGENKEEVQNEGESDEDFEKRKKEAEEAKNSKGKKSLKNEGEEEEKKEEDVKNSKKRKLHNADGEEEKKKEDEVENDDGEGEEKKEEDVKNAKKRKLHNADGDEEKKDEGEVKNEGEEEDKDGKTETEMKNDNGKRKFYELKNAATKRGGDTQSQNVPLETRDLRRARGTIMFGSGNK